MTDWLDPTILALGLVVLCGSFVQSSIGFGIAVVSAPFVVVLRPELMPVALLVCSFVLPVVQLASGPRDIAWRPLGWAVAARVVATPIGVLVVASTSPDAIALAVGVLILVTVIASVVAIEIRLTRGSAMAAGAISGVSGTAASIGGPFLALVLRHEPPDRLRSTLAVFFIAGSVMGIGGLALAGQATWEQLRTGLLWIPFVVVGHLLAGPLRRRMPAEAVRRGVLAFCVVASVSVIARALL
ncbi:sulfite exporter TauE/SafE family protein [Janibacter terrae]|uniref:sulfite exporter TauE/SafE family protein n=1 Tax=Janibacter terrae TaxID=103817 RepID=UPI000837B312|nr:sulfite exporter TauE/SafE family protein [Janibacter terrae]MBA4083863.1 sulfite exporter TauE/SafE family protein [Kytococcus sp.]